MMIAEQVKQTSFINGLLLLQLLIVGPFLTCDLMRKMSEKYDGWPSYQGFLAFCMVGLTS
jgi:hypothetical protein